MMNSQTNSIQLEPCLAAPDLEVASKTLRHAVLVVDPHSLLQESGVYEALSDEFHMSYTSDMDEAKCLLCVVPYHAVLINKVIVTAKSGEIDIFIRKILATGARICLFGTDGEAAGEKENTWRLHVNLSLSANDSTFDNFRDFIEGKSGDFVGCSTCNHTSIDENSNVIPVSNLICSDDANGTQRLPGATDNFYSIFHQLCNNLWAGLWMTTNNDTHIAYINEKFRSIVGRDRETINREGFLNMVTSEDRDNILESFEKAKSTLEVQFNHYEVIRPDGETRYIEEKIFPISDLTCNCTRLVGLALDVTQEKINAENMRQAQKMAEVGKLSTGITHEVSTPIQFIGDNISFVVDNLDVLMELARAGSEALISGKASPTREGLNVEDAVENAFLIEEIPLALEETMKGVARLSEILKAMKNYAHHSKEKARIDINQVIADTIIMTTHKWKNLIELEKNFEDEHLFVYCNRSGIEQVILNLLTNAIQALADLDRDEHRNIIKISTSINNCTAVITIADNGPGISEEIQDKIYTEFFTTKVIGQGTGLGLPISKKIIEEHNGQLYFESKTGEGVTFYINLPENNGNSSYE